jgi:membrane protease subunit HflC
MRLNLFGGLGLTILIVIGVLAYLSIFIVSQTQQALVLRFGNPVRVTTTPGLYFKLPLIDNVVYLDKRLLNLDSSPLEIIASDQKRLVVDAFGRYRIVDPLRFYQAVGTQQIAEQRLSIVLNSAVRRVLGEASFIQLVRDDRAALMQRIADQVDGEAGGLGIQVVDARVRAADLPEANSQAIYQRMQTERQREATEIRAQGEQAARQIRAEADRTATVIVAEANGESEALRGEGEAQRNQILGVAFGQDAEFFAFYRSLQAYQEGLQSGDTRLVITPNSDFFRFFNSSTGLTPPRTTADSAAGPPTGTPQAAAGQPPAPPGQAPAAPVGQTPAVAIP